MWFLKFFSFMYSLWTKTLVHKTQSRSRLYNFFFSFKSNSYWSTKYIYISVTRFASCPCLPALYLLWSPKYTLPIKYHTVLSYMNVGPYTKSSYSYWTRVLTRRWEHNLYFRFFVLVNILDVKVEIETRFLLTFGILSNFFLE